MSISFETKLNITQTEIELNLRIYFSTPGGKVAWLTPTLKNMYRNKKRKYRNNPTKHDLTEYKKFSRLVKTKIIATKKLHEKRKYHQKIRKPSNSITISRSELKLTNQ